MPNNWGAALSKPGLPLARPFRIVCATFGFALLVFGIWVRLIALYASTQVIAITVLLFLAGYGLLLLAFGLLRATGLVSLFIAATDFAHYYIHGNNDGYAHLVSGVVFMALGIVQLLAPRRMQNRDSVLITLDLPKGHVNGGAPQ